MTVAVLVMVMALAVVTVSMVMGGVGGAAVLMSVFAVTPNSHIVGLERGSLGPDCVCGG